MVNGVYQYYATDKHSSTRTRLKTKRAFHRREVIEVEFVVFSMHGLTRIYVHLIHFDFRASGTAVQLPKL